MITVTELDTEFLQLRPFGPEDIDYIIGVHEASAETVFDDVDQFKTTEDFRAYILSLMTNNATGWVVRHDATETPLGVLYFVDILPGVTANFHPVIDRQALKDIEPKDALGQRLRVMDQAMRVAVPYMVERFSLQRVGGAFGAYNVPALRLCDRLGFRREGVIRHGVRIKDTPADLIVYGLIAQEIAAWTAPASVPA